MRRFRSWCALALAGLAVAGMSAGVASARQLATKSYCSVGGTFTTNDPSIQSFLDEAIGASGGFVVYEEIVIADTFGVNEPGESLDDIFGNLSEGFTGGGTSTDDRPLLFPIAGFPEFTFYPVSAGPCPSPPPAGPVAPPAPPPGASHVFLCNKLYPSDANMILAAVSPEGLPQENGSADNPAADAVASGQWFYPFSTGPKSLTCFMPAGAHLTGMTADLEGNALPTDVVNSLHSNGDARTMVYPQVSG